MIGVATEAPVGIADPLQGFDQRKKSGFGYCFDADALNRRNATFMSDVLRGTPGVTVTPGQYARPRDTRGARCRSSPCLAWCVVTLSRLSDGPLHPSRLPAAVVRVVLLFGD